MGSRGPLVRKTERMASPLSHPHPECLRSAVMNRYVCTFTMCGCGLAAHAATHSFGVPSASLFGLLPVFPRRACQRAPPTLLSECAAAERSRKVAESGKPSPVLSRRNTVKMYRSGMVSTYHGGTTQRDRQRPVPAAIGCNVLAAAGAEPHLRWPISTSAQV